MRFISSLLAVTVVTLTSGCGSKDKPTKSSAPAAQVQSKAQEQVQPKPKPQVSKLTSPKADETAMRPYTFSRDNGARFYKRCAACHQPDGAGIPGSFPALKTGLAKLAAIPEGRAYLVLVVENGLRGGLTREGQVYNGVMVRQAAGKSAADVADVLNYILDSFYKDVKPKLFTAKEVAEIIKANGRVNPLKVLSRRPDTQE